MLSIWSAVMPFAGAGHLEVHVAEEVLDALNIGEDDGLVALLLNKAHGDTGHGALDGHAGIHERKQLAQVDAIEEEPLDSRTSETTRMA